MGRVFGLRSAVAYEELAKIAPSAIIELFELRLDSTCMAVQRFTAGIQDEP